MGACAPCTQLPAIRCLSTRMAQNRLYSVVQSHDPYDTHLLVGHQLEYAAAKALSDGLRTGTVSLVPSSDFPDDAKVGDTVEV